MKHSINSFYGYLVVFTAGFFFLLESIFVNAFGTLSIDLMADFHLNAYQLGKLSASYLLANILLLFPAGILLDRLSIRQIMLLAIGVCSLASMIFSMTPRFETALVCVFISGMGGTFFFLSTMKLASRWFSADKLAWITGLVVTLAMLGGLLAQTPTSWLSHLVGWRAYFKLFSVLEAFLCLFSFFILKDSPDAKAYRDLPMDLNLVWKSIQYAVRTPLNWIGGIFTSSMNLPVTLLGAVWGVPFLIQAHHFSAMVSSSINACLFLGMIIGPILSGRLADFLRSRTQVMLLGVFVSLVLVLLLIFLPTQSAFIYSLIFFGLGLFSSVQILGYTVILERTEKQYTGSALSVSCVLVMSGGTFLQPLFGKIMQSFWDGQTANNAPLYSLQAYQSAMLIFPLACVLACLMIALIHRNHKALKTLPIVS